MEKSVRVSEREYSKKMNELNRGFEVCLLPLIHESGNDMRQAVGNSFAGMESRMNEVSSTAIRIGTKASTIMKTASSAGRRR
jgi:exocyst complex component 5